MSSNVFFPCLLVVVYWSLFANWTVFSNSDVMITYTRGQLYALRRVRITANVDDLAQAGVLRYRGSHGRRCRERTAFRYI